MLARLLLVSTIIVPLLFAEAEAKPNIVLVLVDDLGWTDLACQGSTFYETPNIDRLAENGMRFTDAYAACAVCSPTRAAVMTGRYPARIGVTDWIRARFQGGKMPADGKNPAKYVGGPKNKLLCPPNPFWMESQEVTIAERLREVGYATCHIGKWHLGMDDHYPEKQGFDFNFGGCDYGQPPSYFDPYKNKRLADIPTLKPRKEGEYLSDREADEAVKFIRDHRDKPFFLYLANYAVHTPIQAKPDVAAKYAKKENSSKQTNAKYAAMVESVDDAVGKVVQALEENQLLENTLIVFTSDNGGLRPVTHNEPLRSGKGYPYEGGIRVPLIVQWKGHIAAGSTSQAVVSSIDYHPTILDMVGLPKAGPKLDGVSLRSVLEGDGALARDAVYWHFPHYRGRDISPYSIVRAGDYKLLKWHDDRPIELYNLADDLGEQVNLATKETAVTERLTRLLDDWFVEVDAKLPRPNPDYREPTNQ